MEERVNAKMLELNIENKESTTPQKECQKLKKKEEAWNEIEQQYYKAMIDYKHKEGLERKKELWLQEQETRNNTIEKMFV